MRFVLFKTLFSLLPFAIWAQQNKPTHFTGKYAYGEKEGINATNWDDICQLPDGSLVLRPYTQKLVHLINNKAIPVTYDSVSNANYNSTFSYNGSGRWFVSNAGISELVNNQLILKYPLPGNSIQVEFNNNELMVAADLTGHPKLYHLKDGKLTTIATPPDLLGRAVFLTRDNYTGLPVLLPTSKLAGNPFYIYNPQKQSFDYLTTYPFTTERAVILSFGKDSAYFTTPEGMNVRTPAGNSKKINDLFLFSSYKTEVAYKYQGFMSVKPLGNVAQAELPVDIDVRVTSVIKDKFYNSYYLGTYLKLNRIFPNVRTYPFLYNNSNSIATHTIMQTDDGTVYFGSYNGFLSSIKADKVVAYNIDHLPVMPGGSAIKNCLIFFGERNNKLCTYTPQNGVKEITKSLNSGFYVITSTNTTKIYTGNAGYKGIGILQIKDFLKGNYKWNYIDSSKGLNLVNVITIAEDNYHRLWFGRNSQGWGIYYPDSDKAETFLIEKKQTDFGIMSSVLDKNGWIWMGGSKGLRYCNATKKGKINNTDIKQFIHPLLTNGVVIAALKIWKHYLVIGIGKKLLLLDLNKFHQLVISNNLLSQVPLQYINPHELQLNSDFEQNAMLVDKTDSTLWFSSSDMVYNINLNDWLQQPVYATLPTIEAFAGKDSFYLNENNSFDLLPVNNSVDFSVMYQNKDNLPRYLQLALIANGDSVKWTDVSSTNTFSVQNLKSGNYTFLVRVFQHDGIYTEHKFFFTIKKFLWQHWWFWAIISSVVIGVFAFFINLKRKHQIANEKAKTKEAELMSYKSEQEKKIANLQLVTLSSQFRPHFILNALNTIGAQMDDKPEAESVLSRLGESVNLIFNHAQKQKILHPFNSEWQLVENIIHIHRQMYLKQLTTNLPDATIADTCRNINVPLGILQIPIENALLHGLSNRENGPWNLSISISEKENYIIVTINDNGVGRKRSATLSNFTKHGTGTKNINEIISIINAVNKEKITVVYKDDVFNDANSGYGTTVIIEIPKQLYFSNE